MQHASQLKTGQGRRAARRRGGVATTWMGGDYCCTAQTRRSPSVTTTCTAGRRSGRCSGPRAGVNALTGRSGADAALPGLPPRRWWPVLRW